MSRPDLTQRRKGAKAQRKPAEQIIYEAFWKHVGRSCDSLAMNCWEFAKLPKKSQAEWREFHEAIVEAFESRL